MKEVVRWYRLKGEKGKINKNIAIIMESLLGKKMCLFSLVFVALFAKLSSQKIIQVVDESSYYDYEGSKITQVN